ncbi:MAG TPA: type II toxin-antitoxin system VapC family toxin [Solirubrobacteraceae bacterium]|nr:type II toxin-antitoxin system VapC family toxin [Solirubrobacteraceae bacterium]
MAAVYLDTSALGRSLLDEPDKAVIEHTLNAYGLPVSSTLLRVELRRLGFRRNLLDRADALLSGVTLIPLDNEILTAAETVIPPTVATLDAIHLATAVRLAQAGELDAIMTYDKRLADGARAHGLTVIAPS